MSRDFERLAKLVVMHERKLRALSSTPQLSQSSIEDGAIDSNDAEGTTAATFGKQYDGTQTGASLAGPVPPRPVAPSADTSPGVMTIRWNGKFAGDAVSPMDFMHCAVHISTVSVYEPDITTQQATISGETGDLAAFTVAAGVYYVCLVAKSQSGKWSIPSDIISVVVPIAADGDAIGEALDDLNVRYDGVITEAGLLDDRLGVAETDLTSHETRLDTAETDLTNAFGQIADKSKILYQTTAPGVADRNLLTLWIDTTGGANTPKRWTTGTTWVVVTDKVATDAAAAAGTAGANATAALTMAGTKNKVYYDTAVATGTATNVGDLWRQRGGTGGQEIIAEWQWTGSAWVKQTVSGSNVSNMDIGFLTAGAATMSTALINKLVAGTANFQTVDVKNLFVTTGTLTEAVINKLWADVVLSRKITAQMIAVGDFTNMIANAFMVDGITSWTPTLCTIETATAASGALGLKMTKTSTSEAVVYNEGWADVVPGESIRLTYTTEGVWSTGNAAIWTFWKDAAGAVTSFNPGTSGRSVPGDHVTTFVVPSTAVQFRVRPYISNGATVGSYAIFSKMTMRHMNAGELVVDGSITAANLAATAINGKIITGSTFQTHTATDIGLKFDAAGFRAYGPGGGDPVFEIRTDGGTVVSITDAASGDTLASLSSTGAVSGTALNIEADPIFDGDKLLGSTNINSFGTDYGNGILDNMPRGMVARGYRDISDFTATSKEGEILELSYDNLPNRAYRIHIAPFSAYVRPSTYAVMRIYRTNDGSRPTMGSTELYSQPARNQNANSIMVPFGGTFYDIGSSGRVRYLFTYEGIGGQMLMHTYAPFRVWVEDIGFTVVETGVDRSGNRDNGSTPPTPPVTVEKENYTKTYACSSHRSYTGGGDTYTLSGSEPNKMYQGQSPYGPTGITSSIGIFPSMTSDLSGATITSMRVYIYFDFWYNNSGGTADIMLHGQTSRPSTKPSLTNMTNSSGWPKPGGRWIKIPSTYWAGFKSGTYRGIGLGDGTSGYLHYGYATPSKMKIEVKYTK